MDTRQKLKIIQKMLGLTQTKLAEKFGVSFPTLNSWINSKSIPRPNVRGAIDTLFLEVTGQRMIPDDMLIAKKHILSLKSRKYKSVLNEILNNPDIQDHLILKLTYHSNSIEGSTLTEPDTAAILFANTALPHKSLTEHLEAKNHQTALNYLFDHLYKKEKIDENLILKLHGILMNGILPDAGTYRRHAVRIAGVNLPTANYVSVPNLCIDLMKKIRDKDDDIVSLSACVHSKFEQIHPFSDGNGRVGRLLMTAMLIEANLTPAIILQQQKQLYYTYLYKAQTKEDYSQLEDFLCDSIMCGFDILERKDT